MSDLSRSDAIRGAFLESIRTVILVDDDFPPYGTLGPASRAAADDRAVRSDQTVPDEAGDQAGGLNITAQV